MKLEDLAVFFAKARSDFDLRGLSFPDQQAIVGDPVSRIKALEAKIGAAPKTVAGAGAPMPKPGED